MEIIMFLLEKIFFPIIVGIVLFVLSKIYDEKKLTISGIVNASKKPIQKIFDMMIFVIIPVTLYFIVFFYVDFGKEFVIFFTLITISIIGINLHKMAKMMYENDILLAKLTNKHLEMYESTTDGILENQGKIIEAMKNKIENQEK